MSIDDVFVVRDEAAKCRDPECDGVAEPELDGGVRYLTCQKCGFEFGYQRMDDDTCDAGLRPAQQQTNAPQMPGQVSVTIGRKPE